jgi:hypothetical protein
MGNEIAAILDATHAALLKGDLETIGPLARRLDDLWATLRDCPPDDLTLIRAKAARNAATLQAAEQGVRAAQRRLAELQEAASGHRTYARDGHRAVVAGQTGVLRQRV